MLATIIHSFSHNVSVLPMTSHIFGSFEQYIHMYCHLQILPIGIILKIFSSAKDPYLAIGFVIDGAENKL